eukprot:GEMP01050427.1.p1 GENE.GEMP01050427.1~~GEMP01050427.1.p1  ORF type:complete len:420 (+),score=79.00 GEMP01050427.1:35-1294(+)
MKQFCTLITLLAQIRAVDIEDDSRDLTNNAQPNLAPTDGMADEVHRAKRRLHIHESCNAVLPMAMIQLQLMMLSLPQKSQEELLNNFHLGVATSIMKPSMTLLQEKYPNPNGDIQKCQRNLLYPYSGMGPIHRSGTALLSPLSAAADARVRVARGGDMSRKHSHLRTLIAGLKKIQIKTKIGKPREAKRVAFELSLESLAEFVWARVALDLNMDSQISEHDKLILYIVNKCIHDPEKQMQLKDLIKTKELHAPVGDTLDYLFNRVAGTLLEPAAQSELAQELAQKLNIEWMQTWELVVAVRLLHLEIITQFSLDHQLAVLSQRKCRPSCSGRRLQWGGFNGCTLSRKELGYHWPYWLTIVLAVVGGITAIAAIIALGIRRSARRRELQKELTKADEDLEQPGGGAHDDEEGDKGNIAHL